MTTEREYQEQQAFGKESKQNGESPRLLQPEQVKAGTKQIMTHAERQKFLANSDLGRLLGFSHWKSDRTRD